MVSLAGEGRISERPIRTEYRAAFAWRREPIITRLRPAANEPSSADRLATPSGPRKARWKGERFKLRCVAISQFVIAAKIADAPTLSAIVPPTICDVDWLSFARVAAELPMPYPIENASMYGAAGPVAFSASGTVTTAVVPYIVPVVHPAASPLD